LDSQYTGIEIKGNSNSIILKETAIILGHDKSIIIGRSKNLINNSGSIEGFVEIRGGYGDANILLNSGSTKDIDINGGKIVVRNSQYALIKGDFNGIKAYNANHLQVENSGTMEGLAEVIHITGSGDVSLIDPKIRIYNDTQALIRCCCPLKSGQNFLGLTGRDELAG
jgi:hypothetical protein